MNGIRKEVTIFGDHYEGTRLALVAARLCRAEWFPVEPVPYGKRAGAVKRSFQVPCEKSADGAALLRQLQPYSRDRWSLSIRCNEEETNRREAQRDAECGGERMASMAQSQAKEQDEYERSMAAAVQSLAPFAGAVTQAEREHLRVMRALSPRRWKCVAELALGLLATEHEKREEKQTGPQLRLVVSR